MMKNSRLLNKLLIITALSSYSLTAQKIDENFNWEEYTYWENTTNYAKIYIVNRRHPNASDDNEGTAEKPLLTINKAAQLAKPGENVLVYSGVYRETISPKNGGTATDKMIKYEVAPGEKVIVKGSKILNTSWKQRMIFTDVIIDTLLTYTWSRKTWVTTIPDGFFDEDYYPLKLPNILPEEHALMPWANLVKEVSPYTSKRGLFFQDGKRMQQVEDYGDLTRLPGSFWIDVDGKTVHIHGFDSGDPNRTVIEVGVKSHLFKPEKVGIDYIHLSGFTFEHCANGFLRTSTGAITSLGGHHWIIENNIIRNINSSGLEFGSNAFEWQDTNPQNAPRKEKDRIGYMMVRNNTIYNCGTAGIRSFVVRNSIIENNHIYQCGWQDAENYWECSGMKILLAQKTLVKGNYIHDIQGGNGIWLDWDNRYSRVTQNIIHDVQNIQGGIFIEASKLPNLVDNNFVWNIDGNGIYANDTDNLMVYHNLVANITGHVVHAVVQTDRSVNGQKLTAENNDISNNIFINGRPFRFSAESNTTKGNLLISSTEPNYFTESADSENPFMRAYAYFNPASSLLILDPEENIQPVAAIPLIKNDFYGNVLKKSTVLPGPFQFLPDQNKILLNEQTDF